MIFRMFSISLFLLLLTACSLQATTTVETIETHQPRFILVEKKQVIPESFYAKDLKIIAIGDSLTEGVGDTTKNGGYTFFLKNLLIERREIKNVIIGNYGIKGHTTEDLIQRLEKDIPEAELASADIVVITIGGNDMMKIVKNNFLNLSFHSFEEEQPVYEQKLKRIIGKIRSNNKEGQIILVGLYNPFSAIGDLTEEIDTIIHNWNDTSNSVLKQFDQTVFVRVDDLFVEGTERLLYTDEFHPNTRGYELIAERIGGAIK